MIAPHFQPAERVIDEQREGQQRPTVDLGVLATAQTQPIRRPEPTQIFVLYDEGEVIKNKRAVYVNHIDSRS